MIRALQIVAVLALLALARSRIHNVVAIGVDRT